MPENSHWTERAKRWLSRVQYLLNLAMFAMLLSTGRNLDALVAVILAASFLLDLMLILPGIMRTIHDGRIFTQDPVSLSRDIIGAGRQSGALPTWFAWQEDVVSMLTGLYVGFASPGVTWLLWLLLANLACLLGLNWLIHRNEGIPPQV